MTSGRWGDDPRRDRRDVRGSGGNRVPYYGEYLIENDDGEYELNEKNLGTPSTAD